MEKWILCKHKGYVLNIIAPSNNKYKFYSGRPLLIKNKEDIEYFSNHDNYVSVKAPKVVTDKVAKVEDIESPVEAEESHSEEVIESSEANETVDDVSNSPEKPIKKKKSKKRAK